jgi:hypothetical protein
MAGGSSPTGVGVTWELILVFSGNSVDASRLGLVEVARGAKW